RSLDENTSHLHVWKLSVDGGRQLPDVASPHPCGQFSDVVDNACGKFGQLRFALLKSCLSGEVKPGQTVLPGDGDEPPPSEGVQIICDGFIKGAKAGRLEVEPRPPHLFRNFAVKQKE